MAFLLQKKEQKKKFHKQQRVNALISALVRIKAQPLFRPGSKSRRLSRRLSVEYCTILESIARHYRIIVFFIFFFTGFNSIENGQLTGWSIVASLIGSDTVIVAAIDLPFLCSH